MPCNHQELHGLQVPLGLQRVAGIVNWQRSTADTLFSVRCAATGGSDLHLQLPIRTIPKRHRTGASLSSCYYNPLRQGWSTSTKGRCSRIIPTFRSGPSLWETLAVPNSSLVDMEPRVPECVSSQPGPMDMALGFLEVRMISRLTSVFYPHSKHTKLQLALGSWSAWLDASTPPSWERGTVVPILPKSSPLRTSCE